MEDELHLATESSFIEPIAGAIGLAQAELGTLGQRNQLSRKRSGTNVARRTKKTS